MDLPLELAVLSDLDGTLIDSRASVLSAFSWWAQLRGLPPDVAERIPFGRTSTDAAATLAPELDPVEEGSLLDARQAEDTEGVIALPGAADLLASHQRLAIVTSCPLPLATARLTAAGLPVPEVLVTPERWTHGKPHPEPYLIAAAALGVQPRECVVLEDAPAGVRSGLAAGMTVIALLTNHTPSELPGASAYIATPADLPGVAATLPMSPAG